MLAFGDAGAKKRKRKAAGQATTLDGWLAKDQAKKRRIITISRRLRRRLLQVRLRRLRLQRLGVDTHARASPAIVGSSPSPPGRPRARVTRRVFVEDEWARAAAARESARQFVEDEWHGRGAPRVGEGCVS